MIRKKKYYLFGFLPIYKSVEIDNKIKKYIMEILFSYKKQNENKVVKSSMFCLVKKVKTKWVARYFFCGVCVREKWKCANKVLKLHFSNFQNLFLDRKIAVFGILPPEESGIALYNYKTHSILPEKYDVFSAIKSAKNYQNLLDGDIIKNIFPLDFFDYANKKEKYKAKMFILGNSFHHKEILETAIATKGEPQRFLYLHETLLLGLLAETHSIYKTNFVDFMASLYPNIDKSIFEREWMLEFQKQNIFGIRPIINLTGIKNIFVNNDEAKKLIKAELTDEEYHQLNIQTLFLPIENINVEKLSLKKKNEIIIGSFGIPQSQKSSEKIIEAIRILNKKEQKYKLVLAGYAVNDYLQLNHFIDDFIMAYDSPTTEKLYKLMNSVDLAIQLRPHSHGESSGCICQLLGMGQQIVVSEGFISDEQSNYCHVVNRNITSEELAEQIKYAVGRKKQYDKCTLTEKYSFRNLGNILYEKISNNVENG